MPATPGLVACVKLPDLSPKIPALPAGTPCARALYTITTVPSAKVSDASPQIAAGIRETLGLEPSASPSATLTPRRAPARSPLPQSGTPSTTPAIWSTAPSSTPPSTVPDHAPFVLHQGQHQVIAGWDTGFAGMHVGGKRRLFIPGSSPMARRPMAPFPRKAMLIFDVELISQSADKPACPNSADATTPRLLRRRRSKDPYQRLQWARARERTPPSAAPASTAAPSSSTPPPHSAPATSCAETSITNPYPGPQHRNHAALPKPHV